MDLKVALDGLIRKYMNCYAIAQDIISTMQLQLIPRWHIHINNKLKSKLMNNDLTQFLIITVCACWKSLRNCALICIFKFNCWATCCWKKRSFWTASTKLRFPLARPERDSQTATYQSKPNAILRANFLSFDWCYTVCHRWSTIAYSFGHTVFKVKFGSPPKRRLFVNSALPDSFPLSDWVNIMSTKATKSEMMAIIIYL